MHIIELSANTIPGIFFTAAFTYRDHDYLAAVAQYIVTSEADNHLFQTFFVTLQSQHKLQQFSMYPTEEQIWESEDTAAPQEIIYLLGCEIDRIYNIKKK